MVVSAGASRGIDGPDQLMDTTMAPNRDGESGERHQVVDVVAERESDHRALADAEPREVAGGPRHPAREVAVVDALPTLDHRRVVGARLGPGEEMRREVHRALSPQAASTSSTWTTWVKK